MDFDIAFRSQISECTNSFSLFYILIFYIIILNVKIRFLVTQNNAKISLKSFKFTKTIGLVHPP